MPDAKPRLKAADLLVHGTFDFRRDLALLVPNRAMEGATLKPTPHRPRTYGSSRTNGKARAGGLVRR